MRKPITGTWFEFRHHNDEEGTPWNEKCAAYTAEDWRALLRRIKACGMDHIVLLATSLYEKSYFDTDIYPSANLACPNPVEVLMDETEKLGMKVFMSVGYYGNWREPTVNMVDPDVTKRAFRSMEQLTAQFGNRKSFYGWYLPDETCIAPYYTDDFMKYINAYAAEGRKLIPDSKILVAPYGTCLLDADDQYIRQLEMMDADFVAYQDEIGVRKTTYDDTPRFYEALRKAHDKAGRSALWADVEVFEFEKQVYHSALLPADPARVKKQLDAISDYVDRVLIYEYQLLEGTENHYDWTF